MTGEQLRADVAAELSWDPKVGIQAIAGSAEAGTVTPRGTVGSFRAKREAGRAACRVDGVIGVHHELGVWLLDDSRRDDAELRGGVLQALMPGSLIPAAVDARARNGSVTLSGTAGWQYQRAEAEFLAASVPGVTALHNDIRLTPAPGAGDVKKDISEAFRRHARLGGGRLSVETASCGRVALAGPVGSRGRARRGGGRRLVRPGGHRGRRAGPGGVLKAGSETGPPRLRLASSPAMERASSL